MEREPEERTPVRPDDLTAKARIRNAAFALIAQDGVDAATVRAIARRAGVSPSLVLHHFGSKQGVVDEVATWVTDVLGDVTRDTDSTAGPAEAHRRRQLRFERTTTEAPLLGAYLRRMLLDGTENGLEWFTLAVDASVAGLSQREALGIARPSADVHVTAAMLALLGFAPVLLRPHLEHALRLDFDDENDRRRWRDAETALLTSALYSRRTATDETSRAGRGRATPHE
ncbi:TetR/AcrR family transcriptional regulator [Pseudofrankia sp. BMG5.36]|uniref:TetR/AcrR family transcriptional regulator n=1 Tax=Pseudofrankia sp. BMG5.36 TaxID=1834512 RepID=UPI0008DA751A|nr:TetR/AcrR family transcriptional regulator [Pseudofrankia sp. BMG5.36]OHV60590.1 transcriptional regulator [Pseudofrankia sp. BMG5.36]